MFESMKLSTLGLPVATVAAVALIFILPLMRHRLRTGTWALVVRESSGAVEHLVRWWMTGIFAAIVAWAVLVPSLGPAAVGVWSAHAALSWLGVGAMIVGLAIIVIAQAQMGSSWRIGIDDTPTSLVTSGLFRVVRHPIYTGIFFLIVGIVCLTPAAWTMSASLLAYVLIAIQARLEEQHLLEQHGEAYRSWAVRVGRFVPGVGRLRGSLS